MGRIFDLDSPLMRGLGKMADVMWLNILVLIFAIPLIVEQFFTLGVYFVGGEESFLATNLANAGPEMAISMLFRPWLFGIICCIPLGPALTAMHFVLLKLVRNEESYLTKTFFKSFRENFVQSSILMVIQFIAAGILLFDYLLMSGNSNTIIKYILIAVTIILYMASLYIFPLQAKFVNSLPGTLKNSFLVSIMALPKTVAMAIVTLVPVILAFFMFLKIVPLLFLFGIAGPGYLCAVLYSETFKKFEPKEETVSEEEELENAIKKIDDEDQQ